MQPHSQYCRPLLQYCGLCAGCLKRKRALIGQLQGHCMGPRATEPIKGTPQATAAVAHEPEDKILNSL